MIMMSNEKAIQMLFESYREAHPKFDYISKNFTLTEMTKSSTASRLNIRNNPNDYQIFCMSCLARRILEPIRKHFGIPFSPNSAYRSKALNKAIGGSETSQHCQGEAVDIEIPRLSNLELFLWIKDNLNYDQLILEHHKKEISDSGWVHVSTKLIKSENRKEILINNGRGYKKYE